MKAAVNLFSCVVCSLFMMTVSCSPADPSGELDATGDGTVVDDPGVVADAVEDSDDVRPDQGATDTGFDSVVDAVADMGLDATDDGADTPDTYVPVDSDLDGLFDHVEEQLGTDPLVYDTDRDGIGDGDEVAAGTNPLDPSSASAWHPELGVHPRLFFDASAIDGLAAKMDAVEAPMSTLAARIRSVAAQSLPAHPDDGFSLTVDRGRARIAENAAFIALVSGDTTMLDKATSAIVDGYVNPAEAALSADSDYDLYGSEALVAFCSAWDFIAGNPAIEAGRLADVRQALITRIDDFRYMVHEGSLFYMMLFAKNNHVLKVFGSLGLCAMALNDRSTAAYDLSEAMTGIDWLFNGIQATPDGGMAEGGHYLTYGSDTYLPLFVAWHRYAAGDTFPFKAVGAIQGENPLSGQVVQVEDFAENQITRNVYRLALDSVTPSGLCPDTDDSNGAPQHGPILNRLFDDPDFLWQWFRPAAGFMSDPLHVLSLVSYDNETSPGEPSGPLDFMKYQAGMSVFRSSWDQDALYLYMCGEHGPVRVNGIGHEHPDELSFLMWDNGKPLIIDPGYINFENHALVYRPKDHNTILVDGVGSPFDTMSEIGIGVGTDAYFSCMGAEGDYTWAAVTTSYEGVDFQRRIVRVGQDYFVVEDLIDADAEHQYTWLLNGMGGGTTPDSSFALGSAGATWTNGDTDVMAFVLPLSGTPVTSSILEEHHAPAWGQWFTHERLAMDVVMQPGTAGFVSIIAPSPADGMQPEVTGDGADGFACAAVSFPDREPALICSAATAGAINPDGSNLLSLERGLSVFEPDENDVLHLVFHLPPLDTASADPACGGGL